MTLPFDADVAIIGYGPSGVTAANALGARGVPTIVFEAEKDIYPRARAVTVNEWTMRVFQAVGLHEALRKDMTPYNSLRWVNYAGQEIYSINFPPSTLGDGASSYMLYQPVMEETLRRGAERFPDVVSVRFGCEVVGVAQDTEGVTITARDRSTGETTTTRARYALGCDGGGSATRKAIGATLQGDTEDVTWVVIDARVKRWWPDRNKLTFWSDKVRPVVDIPLAQGNHRWEIPLGRDESVENFATAEQIWPLLEAMGITQDDVQIHQHAFYKHHVRMADRWRVGRVFLVGDAAHLMPPWAGNGMQSGIRDAYDISWKLAAVLAGRAPDSFLDSYQMERGPNVAMFTEMSVGLGKIIKQELSEEEMAAVMAPPPEGEEPPPPPLVLPPFLVAGWFRGPLDEASAVGKMVPQPLVATPRGRIGLLDDVIGDCFALLGDDVDPASLLSPVEKAEWDALGTRYLIVRPPTKGTTGPEEIVDIDGVVGGWLRAHGARVVALRPDRFVAAADVSGLAVPTMDHGSSGR
ncbi:bifunctional 3-(3-hydroxy-phenyl)propionate/3-hydroxycinnamic acid hydroxylase [Geodermatophilus ruber]|uniref:3-(3-hydroxy-phenyl)propionate hydroxylase n=1 Tax=Geodermatophilus ruber TaxID=504800 RepID=A0A1I4J3Y7_9ACTN|nr:bifunctional 3-(3-hydroxy-phenyl)propionate/3-hydroxycinnamic acid hydroxylase [Geodermatophilus ruber]SFL61322.1 3-(3-hydroxy-phenyl)propionate hydroxylase [Geodermatophilus ruber]